MSQTILQPRFPVKVSIFKLRQLRAHSRFHNPKILMPARMHALCKARSKVASGIS